MYKGWDVHFHTGDLREALKDRTFATFIAKECHERMMAELLERYETVPQAAVAILKMKGRYREEVGGYLDPDLGLNVTAILDETWATVKQFAEDESVLRGFGEILADVGTTCIQGDSHRLLFYLLGLEGDTEHHRPSSTSPSCE